MIEERVQPLLEPAKWQGKIFSNGWRDAAGGTADVTDKSTGASLGRTGVANKADIAEAAKRAQGGVSGLGRDAAPPSAPRSCARPPTCSKPPPTKSPTSTCARPAASVPKGDFEVSVAVGELREAAGLCEHAHERRVIEKTDEVESVAVRVPIGVVGVISPWNAPLILSMRSVAPAIAVGCTVVLKPDVQTPVSGGFVIAAALAAAGLPDGVLHVLPGDAEPGAALCTDPNINMISFTGSTQVGRLVGEAAGRTLKRVALELGGNSPFIVLDDADLELATSAGAFGSFFFQGQICMASSRHLVHEKIADAYTAKLTERTAKLGIGNPATEHVHLGPLINDQQLERVTGIVDRTLAAGAKASTGATHEGRFYRPTVLTGVTPEMAAFTDEIFGPVAPITTFKNDEEAIELANRTEYGLSAAIFSNDVGSRDEDRGTAEHGARAHQRSDDQRRPAHPVRRHRRVGQRRTLRLGLKPRRVHHLALDDDPRPRPPLPVLRPLRDYIGGTRPSLPTLHAGAVRLPSAPLRREDVDVRALDQRRRVGGFVADHHRRCRHGHFFLAAFVGDGKDAGRDVVDLRRADRIDVAVGHRAGRGEIPRPRAGSGLHPGRKDMDFDRAQRAVGLRDRGRADEASRRDRLETRFDDVGDPEVGGERRLSWWPVRSARRPSRRCPRATRPRREYAAGGHLERAP